MPLVAGVNEDWDENTTRAQLVRPDWDFSPIRMQTMHHLPHIFFDTLGPERPDCPVLIPSSFLGFARQNHFPEHIQLRTMRSANRELYGS